MKRWQFILLMLVAIGIVAADSPPIPKLASRATIEANGGIWLSWVPGNPRTSTVVNITTGAITNVGSVSNFVVMGLPMGSTNTFVVTNIVGASNEAIGVSTNQTPNGSISIYSFLVSVPAYSNKSTLVYTSTNLLTWQRIAMIVTTNKSYQFVWTNDGGSRFFRSIAQ